MDRERSTAAGHHELGRSAGPARGSGEDGPSRDHLRQFGFVMAVALLAVAGLLWWRDRPGPVWVAGIAGVFAVVAVALPRWLAPVERAWMALARMLGEVVSRVVLLVTYYLVITPIGLIMRLVGKDPLARSFDPEADTYWVPVEPDGPSTRPDKPF